MAAAAIRLKSSEAASAHLERDHEASLSAEAAVGGWLGIAPLPVRAVADMPGESHARRDVPVPSRLAVTGWSSLDHAPARRGG